MPQPTASDVHVDVPLTQISIAYIQDATNFVAARVFPVVSVQKQSDRYWTFDRHAWNRDEMAERAPSTESAGGGWTVDSTPSYYAPVYALHKDVDDQVRANSDPQVNPDAVATQYLTQKALIKRDRLWATKYFATSIWTTDIDGVDATPGAGETLRWNVAGSTPIEDVSAGRLAVEESTGFIPNVLVVSPHVLEELKNHASILDRIKYTQRGMVALDLLAALFEVDEVVVPRGIYTSQAEGATGTGSYIVGKHALLAYRSDSPSLMTPSAGYTFSWNGYLGAGGDGNRVSSFRMDPIRSDRVELEMSFDQKLVAADLGYFFNTIVA
jgi:hypothetical protein